MVYFSKLCVAVAVASGFLASVSAHPGGHDEDVHAAVHKRNELADLHGRSLAACAGSLKSRALQDRAVKRRHAKAQELRTKRGIETSELPTAKRSPPYYD